MWTACDSSINLFQAEFFAVMQGCFAEDPSNRPTFRSIAAELSTFLRSIQPPPPRDLAVLLKG
jgi:hypothetical protein